VRAVQNARKEAGLEVTDRIELSLGGDGDLVAAAREHEDYVAGEVLARTVTYGAGNGGTARIEGRELRIAIKRAA
jgi:isoleucyl-tRNA synthetase